MSTTTSPPTIASPTSSTLPSCYTAVPGKYGYVPPEACNANWAYSPSFPAAIAIATLFGILTIAHIALAVLFRKGFSWVMIMGVIWEFTAFITRALGAHDQQNLGYAFASSLLFLLAPLWINAYVYMTAGRLIWTFHPDKKIWIFKAISIGKYFVCLDIFSFIVQGIGGTMLSPGASANTMKTGKDIYMTGIGVQELFILLFCSLVVKFTIDVQRLEPQGVGYFSKRWQWVTYAVFAALALISVRIFFRLAEFSAGVGVSNPLPYHEGYALGLDAVPMILAVGVFAVFHPGLALKGKESEFPSRKVRKAEKAKIKEEKKARKDQKKRAKNGVREEFFQSNRSSMELNRI